jgi:hypothetical protein
VRLLTQEFPEQWMVLIGRARVLVSFGEMMMPHESVEQRAHAAIARLTLRHVLRETREQGGLHQEFPERRRSVREDFRCEVIEQRLGAASVRCLFVPGCGARTVEQQDETCHPAFALPMQTRDTRGARRFVAARKQTRERARLFLPQGELARIQTRKLPVRSQAGQRFRRFGAADENDMRARRQLL